MIVQPYFLQPRHLPNKESNLIVINSFNLLLYHPKHSNQISKHYGDHQNNYLIAKRFLCYLLLQTKTKLNYYCNYYYFANQIWILQIFLLLCRLIKSYQNDLERASINFYLSYSNSTTVSLRFTEKKISFVRGCLLIMDVKLKAKISFKFSLILDAFQQSQMEAFLKKLSSIFQQQSSDQFPF